MAYVPNSGSVVAFQGAYSNLRAQVSIAGIPQVEVVGSVATSVTPVANQSVSGTVGASVLGHAPVVIVGGSILTSSTANQSVSGTVGASVVGHAPVVIVGGSILTSSTANQSVSGTVGASVIGTVPVVQSGTVITSLVSTIPSSVIVGASIMGHAPVFIVGGSVATSTTNSSVMLLNGANVIGSVTALQGTNPWIVVSSLAGGLFPISGSVAAIITNTNINVGGSVVGFQGGTTISSLVSTIPSSVIVG